MLEWNEYRDTKHAEPTLAIAWINGETPLIIDHLQDHLWYGWCPGLIGKTQLTHPNIKGAELEMERLYSEMAS